MDVYLWTFETKIDPAKSLREHEDIRFWKTEQGIGPVDVSISGADWDNLALPETVGKIAPLRKALFTPHSGLSLFQHLLFSQKIEFFSSWIGNSGVFPWVLMMQRKSF